MAKLVSILFVLCWYTAAYGQSTQLREARELFLGSAKNPLLSNELHKRLSASINITPVLRAYKGVSEAMKAKQATNVYKKYKLFASGRDTLEVAVKQDPENFEIRFIRFLFQNSIPAFLMYDNREADKQFLVAYAPKYFSAQADKAFSERVSKILNEIPYLTDVDKQKMNKIKIGYLSD